MKTRMFVKLAFAITLVGILAISAAAEDWTVRADIPFAFQVGSARMPAGLYQFSRYGNDLLLIKSLNGKVIQVTSGSPLNASRTAVSPKVDFNRYGDLYVMSSIVLDGGYSLQFSKSKLEAEYQASGGGFTPIEVAAQR